MQREIKLIKIEQRIKEVEDDNNGKGCGKIVIFVEKGEIKTCQIIKNDKLDKKELK